MNWNSRENWSENQSSPSMGIAPYSIREISPQRNSGGYDGFKSTETDQLLGGYPERSTPPPAPRPDSFDQARREPLLTSAVVVSILIMLYEVIVVVAKPSWLVVATDWVRASLSWVELLPVLLAAILLYRHRKPGAVAWTMFAAAMLSYAIAQTAWLILDQFIVPGNVPVPSLADLFYLLQYPFFFLGLALLPGIVNQGRPGIARAKVVLDSVLLMAAGTALSWYFLLAPFYLQSGQSVLGKATNMAYPVGDLGLLFGLTVVLISQNRQVAGQAALRLFIPAVLFLIIADSIFLNEELYTSFVPGDAANVAWMACYILFALAGLIRFRGVQREDRIGGTNAAQVSEQQSFPSNREVKGVRGLQSLIPFLAAVIASTLIVFRAATAPFTAGGGRNLIIPFLVGLGLLALVGARQGITVLENERLLRSEKRRAEELDQAKQVAEQQRRLLAERNERLQVDIQMLKDIHARVAGGDYSARVPITSGELLPIAGSLNIMLDRLSNLIRASSNYTRLEQAIRVMEMAAHGIADGDDRALQGLSIQTNTALDGVSIALRKIRTRVQELGMGLQNLEHVRKTAHELNEMTAHQSQSLTEESAALNKVSETLAQFVADLEHIIPLQARSLNMSPMNNRQTGDWVQFLRQLVEIIREQQKQINTQVARLNRLKEQANLSASGSRRLVTELNAIAQADTNRMLPSGTQYETGRLTRKSVNLSSD